MRLFKYSVLFGLLIGLLVACNSGSFSITLDPGSLNVAQGLSANILVKLTRQSGFSGEVTITLNNPPEGIISDTLTLPDGASQGFLEISAGAGVTVGRNLSLKVVASGGPSLASALLDLSVSAAAPTSEELIGKDLQDGTIDYATSMLYRAYAIFSDDRLPPQYKGTVPPDDDGFFLEASRPDLPIDLKTKLKPFLSRPTDPTSVFNQSKTSGLTSSNLEPLDVTCTEGPGQTVLNGWKSQRIASPLRIWTQCTDDPQEDDRVLRLAIQSATKIVKLEINLMGSPVLDDGGDDAGTDTAIDVYLVPRDVKVVRDGVEKSLSLNVNGNTTATDPFNGNTSSGFILIHRDRVYQSGFPSTLAHEFFHVLEYAHNFDIVAQPNADGSHTEYWFVEAAATWASTHFARSVAIYEVHLPRFVGVFQPFKESLHTSKNFSSSGVGIMYAGYIWPFFFEQKTNGPQSMKTAWNALKAAASQDQANKLLNDSVYDFKTNFRLFAVENYNADLPGVLDKGKRYIALDPKFPDGKTPAFAAYEALVPGDKLKPDVNIAPLRAAYYVYTVQDTKIKKVVFNFEEITIKDGLDIDGLVKIEGKDWEKRDYSGQKEVKFCLDKPDEKLTDIILVLSNHNLPLDKFVLGNLKVEADTVPCEGSWSGTATAEFGYTMKADVTFNYDEDNSTPNLAVYTPSGTVSFTADPASGCVISPGGHDISPEEGSLNIDFSTNPPTYKAEGATVWPATYTCNGHSSEFSAGGIWLGFATGSVSDDGNTIEGSANSSGFSWTWKLTKN